MLFLCRWSKESLASSKDVTSFLIKSVPFWMGHTVGTTNFAMFY
jgi:hypothetical protein